MQCWIFANEAAWRILKAWAHSFGSVPGFSLFERMVEQLKARDGITEELKAANQMEWVRQMNAIRSEAETVVMGELIYE